MNKAFLVLLATLLYISFAPTPAFAFDSFGFYCSPYIRSFEEGKHYTPTNTNAPTYITCWFEIPQSFDLSSQEVRIAVYKGTAANAQFLFGTNISPFYPINTPYQYLGTNFITYDANSVPSFPAQDDNFFAVVYEKNSWNANTGTPVVGASSNNYKIINWKWGAKPASEWDPVILIPGILGSWEKNGTWILDPLAHTYDNLINTLKANGYEENKNLFTLPYDWEQSNVTTAQLLKQKIDQIKVTCSCSKVDIIAHSMGGLVAEQYVMNVDYQNDIDQLFMLGTPIAGAPKAYKTWESGEIDFGDEQINFAINFIFDREATKNNYSNVFEYIHNKPVTSIKELLPVYQNYLKQGSTVLQYPTGYPQNPFLENLIGNPTNYYTKHKNIQTYVVVGNLIPNTRTTPIGYVVKTSTQLPKWEHGEIVSTISGDGDGTVPLDNAIYFSGPEKELQGVRHVLLASSSSAYVFSQLTGSSPLSIVGKIYQWYEKDFALLLSKLAPTSGEYKDFIEKFFKLYMQAVRPGSTFLFITRYSPIEMQITAPDGKKLGKDFSTGANLSEIPNAVYSGPIGEHEYILIENPLPGTYKVDTVGTGNGAYTIAAARMDSATSSISLTSGTTTLNQIISNTLFYSSTSTSITLTPPPPPVATSTPITPDTCVKDITKAYQDKWITKKAVYEKLVFDCKAIKELLKTRGSTTNLKLIALINTAIRLTLADMELLAKDRGNTKDAVLLITKITIWFREHELHL